MNASTNSGEKVAESYLPLSRRTSLVSGCLALSSFDGDRIGIVTDCRVDTTRFDSHDAVFGQSFLTGQNWHLPKCRCRWLWPPWNIFPQHFARRKVSMAPEPTGPPMPIGRDDEFITVFFTHDMKSPKTPVRAGRRQIKHRVKETGILAFYLSDLEITLRTPFVSRRR